MANNEIKDINGYKLCDEKARDSMVTSIKVNNTTYTQVDGLITLPNYPSVAWEGSSNSMYYNVLDYGITTEADDNTTALQTLIDTVNANGGGTIYFPSGTYIFKKCDTIGYAGHKYAVKIKNNVSIKGENSSSTILKCVDTEALSLFYYFGENINNPIIGCTFENFTVDQYETGDVNKVWGKAFYFQFVKNCTFKNLVLKGTIATAMGIDYLDQVIIDSIICIDCGRTFISESATTGTSGIGIGSGGYENENFIITNCICVGCGQYGIFVENQHTLGWGGTTNNPKGNIISNCIVRNGLFRGIGVRGGTNTIVENCISYENTKDGFYLDNLCKNVQINNCQSINNGNDGILLKTNENSSDIILNNNILKDNTKYGIEFLTNTTDLVLFNNITKGNTKGVASSALTHANVVAKNNVFKDGKSLLNTVFEGDNNNNELYIPISSDVAITSIESSNISLVAGGSVTLKYSVLPENADPSKVTASTLNSDIINLNGFTVTALKEGTATVTFSAEDGSVTKDITINVVNLETITLENSQFTKGYKLDTTGTEISSVGSAVSTQIPIAASTYYDVDFEINVKIRGAILCEYDSEDNLVLRHSLYDTELNDVNYDETNYIFNFTTQANTSYIKISINNIGSTGCVIKSRLVSTISYSDLLSIKLDSSGLETTESGWLSTDYIYVTQGTTISVNPSSTQARVAYYDSSKSAINTPFDFNASTKITTLNITDENIGFIRISSNAFDPSLVLTIKQ